MTKISKSDTLDVEQEQSDRNKLNELLSTPSAHFSIGSSVVYKRMVLIVESYHNDWVALRKPGSGLYLVKNPYFMQWRA